MLIDKKVIKRKKRIGIFLGTFDPIHNAHIHIAQGAIKNVGLDSVIILPSFKSPHKGEGISISSKERMTMCELACYGENLIIASDVEIKNKLEGYSLKKIDLIADDYPNSELYYIIGSDAYLSIRQWDNLEDLIGKVVFCVIMRNYNDTQRVEEIKSELEVLGGKTHICNFKTLDISSTGIREKIRRGDSIKDLVDKRVENFILANNLYLK